MEVKVWLKFERIVNIEELFKSKKIPGKISEDLLNYKSDYFLINFTFEVSPL